MTTYLRRGPNGEPISNVPHRVTRGNDGDIDERLYEWGYPGAGPNELSMNILYNAGLSEADALRLSTFFTHDIISGIPHEGASIDDQVVWDWVNLNRDRRA